MATGIFSLTFTAAWNGTGTAPAGSVLPVPVNEYSAFGFEIGGVFNGSTVLLEVFTGITWITPNVFTILKAAGSATLTAAAQGLVQTAGLIQIRGRCSVFNSPASPQLILAGSLAGV